MALMTSNVPSYVQVVVNPYGGVSNQNRKGIMIGGPWVDEIASFVQENDIKAVYFNSAKGWKGSDFSFLTQLKTVEELSIISSSANGLEALEEMDCLKELSITATTKDKVDFAMLQNLEKCYLYWWTGAASITECYQLTNLYLDKPSLKDFSKLSALTRLSSLTLANCQVNDLHWLKSLSELTELEFLNCRKLNDFLSIQNCPKLTKLTIRGSRLLSNLDFVVGLRNLEVLVVSDNGDIDSLAPLAELKGLKALSFAGSTVVKDGNLSVLEVLPKLSMLMFQGKKFYTHKLIKKWDWSNFDIPDILLEKTGK